MQSERPNRGYLTAIFNCHCPRCREGKLFKHPLTIRFKKNMEMHDRCPVCDQPTDIEVGFYYGTGYVSYVLGLLFSLIYFLLWLALIGFSFEDNRFLIWIISNSVLLAVSQPWLMRFSRVLWLSWFVDYDPEWPHHRPAEPERVNEEQKYNW